MRREMAVPNSQNEKGLTGSSSVCEPGPPALSLEGASLGYPGKVVMENLDLRIEQGAFAVLLGPSGSGKSTLLKTVAGLLPLRSGTLCLNGLDAGQLPPEKRNTPILFQDLRLFPHLTVGENLAFPLKLRHVSREEQNRRIRETLLAMGLEGYAERDVGSLSGGEQQRVALARATIFHPRLLLLDEAFSSLDLALKQNMRELLQKLHEEQAITILFVTHDLFDALALASQLVLLDRGHLLCSGDPRTVLAAPQAQAYLAPWRREIQASRLLSGKDA